MRAVTRLALWIIGLSAAACVPPLQNAMAQEPSDDFRIALPPYEFDPLIERPDVPAHLRLEDDPTAPAYRIVQFDGPLSRTEVVKLKSELGLRLNDAVPGFAFLERLSPAQVERLRTLPYFRWSGVYQPAFKLDPNIGKHEFVTERRRAEPGLLLMVVAFPEVSVKKLAQTVRSLGFEVVSITDEPKRGIRRLQVRVNAPADAEAIARLDEVRHIEEVGAVTLNLSRY